MGAKPSIVSATGYKGNGNDIWLMCLYENKKSMGYTQGMAKFQGSRYNSAENMCYQDIPNALIKCINTTEYNLKIQTVIRVNLGAPFNFGCLESFGCSAGDDCSARTCATWGSRWSFVWDIPVVTQNFSPPPNPGPITVTPGNAILTIAWKKVADPTGLSEVFSYYIVIIDPTTGDQVISGFMEAGSTSATIGGLTNGKKYNVEVRAISHNSEASSVATGTGTPAGATNPYLFSIFTTPDAPATGASFTIEAQIANRGPSGKVRAVFKVDGTQISDQNSTLVTFTDPGRVLWKPTVAYTMPNKTITITIEAYGWDGSKWVLTDTASMTRTPSVIPPGVTLRPFAASIKAGEKVTFTAAVTPSTTQFTVQFKDRAGTLLGTCTTSGGSCTFIWDSTGKPAGTYYVRAYVTGGESNESVIDISPALRQWNVNIYARDSTTGNPIEGATVTIGTQSKPTDATGLAAFRVDEGTIDISISKTGYNTKTTVEPVFSDKTFNYTLSPTGIAKGSIHFVTVPVGAEIFIDGADQGVKTITTVTDLPAGDHTFTLKLAGYNDITGPVTVVGGSTVEVYTVLTPSTPGAGSLYISSSPVAADIIIDGQSQGAKTPATITSLTAGSHEVKLTRTGYEDFTTTVTITAGITTYLSATMTVLLGIGTLEISSAPAGARVFIDGADALKVTPATITNLSSGDHTYKLVLAGYKDATGTFTIEAGTTTTLSVSLTKAEAKAGAGTILGISLLGLGVLGAVVYATREKKPEYTLPKYKGG
jgi:hypothetical protein